MRSSLIRPARNHHVKLRTIEDRCFAKNFRKAQIVTNKRRDLNIAPPKYHRLFAGRIMSSFTARSERLHLGIEGDQFTRGRKYQRFIAQRPSSAAHRRARDEV